MYRLFAVSTYNLIVLRSYSTNYKRERGTTRGTEENDSPANLLFISVCEWLQSSSPVSRSSLKIGSTEKSALPIFLSSFSCRHLQITVIVR